MNRTEDMEYQKATCSWHNFAIYMVKSTLMNFILGFGGLAVVQGIYFFVIK